MISESSSCTWIFRPALHIAFPQVIISTTTRISPKIRCVLHSTHRFVIENALWVQTRVFSHNLHSISFRYSTPVGCLHSFFDPLHSVPMMSIPSTVILDVVMSVPRTAGGSSNPLVGLYWPADPPSHSIQLSTNLMWGFCLDFHSSRIFACASNWIFCSIIRPDTCTLNHDPMLLQIDSQKFTANCGLNFSTFLLHSWSKCIFHISFSLLYCHLLYFDLV